MENDQIYLLAIGDQKAGCSAFIRSCHSDHHIYPAHHLIKKAYQDQIAWVQIDGTNYIKLEAWDATGDYEYQRIISLPFPHFHIYAIFFSVVQPQTFHHAIQKWYEDLNIKKKDCQIVFIGTQIDAREKIVNQKCDQSNVILKEKGQSFIKGSLNCNYFECSAKTGQGVRQIYQQIVKIVMTRNAIQKHTADEQTSCQCKMI